MKNTGSILHWHALLGIGLGVCINACTTAAVQPVPSAQALPRTASESGIPNLPDLVTVVPFVPKRRFTAADSQNLDRLHLQETVVPIMVSVDGHRGLFILDLGAPWLALTPKYFRLRRGGGVDTAMVTSQQMGITHVQVQIGTLRDEFTDSTLPPIGIRFANANALLMDYTGGTNLDCCVTGPAVGNLGLGALEPFETIIDYTRQRVIFIRLDSAGHRLAPVPAYTPRWSVPLLDIQHPRPNHYWGIKVRPDDVLDTQDTTQNTVVRMLDTGSPLNSHEIPGLPLKGILGYPFLSQFGVIGFNHRTHQIIFYTQSKLVPGDHER